MFPIRATYYSPYICPPEVDVPFWKRDPHKKHFGNHDGRYTKKYADGRQKKGKRK